MSSGGANVGSIDAVRFFRAVMHTFAKEATEALSSFDMEVSRTLDWLTDEMPQYWRNEIRRCEELLQEARIDLERCRNTPLPGGGTPSCMEQKKALEKAKVRLAYAEEKLEVTRKWAQVAQREVSEYTGRSNQLTSTFDSELPRAIVELDRALRAPRGLPGTARPDRRGRPGRGRGGQRRHAIDGQPPAGRSGRGGRKAGRAGRNGPESASNRRPGGS